MKRTMLISAVLASVTMVLAACGGGGGGSSTPETPTPVTPTAPAPIVVQSTIDEAVVELNRLLAPAGVKPTANAQVMVAADSHAKWLAALTTTVASLHSEDPGTPGFTGASFDQRVKAAGYAPFATGSEVIDPNHTVLDGKSGPVPALRGLMNVPYHGLAMLLGNADVGIGVAAKDANTVFTVINFASKTGAYVPVPAGEVRMWPCNGVIGILNKSVAQETPNPIAGRRLDTEPIGTPAYVMVTEGKTLVLTTYDIRPSGGGQAVAIAKVLGQSASDGLPANQAAILPDKPLAVGVAYTATVTGLNNGQPFSKVCTWTASN